MVWRTFLPLAMILSAQTAEAGPRQDPVSRLPALPRADPAATGDSSPLNSELAMAHAPKLVEATRAWSSSMRGQWAIPRALRELAIVRTAQIADSAYVLYQHRPMLKVCGYSDRQIADLHNWRSSRSFDPKSRALLAFVDEMGNRGNVSDPTFNALAAHFNPREIVELGFTVSSYYGTAIMLKGLKVRTDDHAAYPHVC
jgi:alkylhydroperoxidase family enzyme